MRAIYKFPGKGPEIIEVDNTLKALQSKVGGYIETVTLAEDCAMIVNEEGQIRAMPYNMNVLGIKVHGPLLLVGVAGDEFTDLSDPAVRVMFPYLKEKSERHV